MNTDDIKRIEDLEYKYNEASRVMAALDMVFDEYTNIKDWICELKDYWRAGSGGRILRPMRRANYRKILREEY